MYIYIYIYICIYIYLGNNGRVNYYAIIVALSSLPLSASLRFICLGYY